MRGTAKPQVSMLCMLNPEDVVPKDHPLRSIKRLCDEALREVEATLSGMYAERGRPSVPPERLLKAMVLMALYSVRSDRQLCEQVTYNLLFRWFLDMDMTSPVWDPSTFSHNRERLLDHDVARQLFGAVVGNARSGGLVSAEHFSVDGTLIEAWASLKSFRPKDEDDEPPTGDGSRRNRWVDFHGEPRKNDTHESKTDPEAKLLRKGNGKEAKLCFGGHALMENRHGLLVDLRVTPSVGTTESDAALGMLREVQRAGRATVGADRGFDNPRFIDGCREQGVTPHVATYRPKTRVDRRTTRHIGYAISQRVRKRIEEIFGWMKSFGGLRRTRFKGRRRTELLALTIGTAYNLLRVAKLQLRLGT